MSFYKLKFRRSDIREVRPGSLDNSILLTVEVFMGAKAVAWKAVKQLLADLNERTAALEAENARLRAGAGDPEDLAADAEMAEFASAVGKRVAAEPHLGEATPAPTPQPSIPVEPGRNDFFPGIDTPPAPV